MKIDSDESFDNAKAIRIFAEAVRERSKCPNVVKSFFYDRALRCKCGTRLLFSVRKNVDIDNLGYASLVCKCNGCRKTFVKCLDYDRLFIGAGESRLRRGLDESLKSADILYRIKIQESFNMISSERYLRRIKLELAMDAMGSELYKSVIRETDSLLERLEMYGGKSEDRSC